MQVEQIMFCHRDQIFFPEHIFAVYQSVNQEFHLDLDCGVQNAFEPEAQVVAQVQQVVMGMGNKWAKRW